MQLNVNPSIFRGYDIRGIYPSEVNEKVAYEIGQTLVNITGAKKVVAAKDARLSSPSLFKALVKGITDKGASVWSIGQAPTECVYFAIAQWKQYDAGVIVTASHNPKDYNGFKALWRKDGKINLLSSKDFEGKLGQENFGQNKVKGKLHSKKIWPDFLRHIFSFIDVKKIKPFKVIIDASSGAAGKIMPLVLRKLPLLVVPLNFKPDGNFPAHSPNPLEKGATTQAKREIVKNKADCGFIFDSDADRVFLIDEKGNLVKGDTSLLLLAKHFLEQYPGKGVVYNAVCSKAVPEFVKKWGGKPFRAKVGYLHLKEAMEKQDGIVSGEVSGHFTFRDNHYLDSGFIAFLILLEVISQENKKVSQIVASLSPYFKVDEINFKVVNQERVLKKIKKKYSGGKQDYLDGVTVNYRDWWFNVRPSNTELLLRLVVEAKSASLARAKVRELSRLILG